MAKLLVIIICVCTACVHLAWSQMARKELRLQHGVFETKRYGNEFSPQDQLISASEDSDLEYGRKTDPSDFSKTNIQSDIENDAYRVKRHAGHEIDINHEHFDTLNPVTDEFVEKLFKTFAISENETMNLIEFETMVKKLGLDRLINDNQLNYAKRPDEAVNTGGKNEHLNETVRFIKISFNSHSTRHFKCIHFRCIIFFSLKFSNIYVNSAYQPCLWSQNQFHHNMITRRTSKTMSK